MSPPGHPQQQGCGRPGAVHGPERAGRAQPGGEGGPAVFPLLCGAWAGVLPCSVPFCCCVLACTCLAMHSFRSPPLWCVGWRAPRGLSLRFRILAWTYPDEHSCRVGEGDQLLLRFLVVCAGVLPHGVLPHGVLPCGVLPHGVLPHGVLPHGVLPHGVLPHGVLPHGVLPHGVLPHGVLPHGVLPCGVPPSRPPPWAAPLACVSFFSLTLSHTNGHALRRPSAPGAA